MKLNPCPKCGLSSRLKTIPVFEIAMTCSYPCKFIPVKRKAVVCNNCHYLGPRSKFGILAKIMWNKQGGTQ